MYRGWLIKEKYSLYNSVDKSQWLENANHLILGKMYRGWLIKEKYSLYNSVDKSQWLENPDHQILNESTEAG
jgi:hypothetical protein